jgi:hypothetical protein
MKTAYIVSPGLQLPENYQWHATPVILAQPAIWEACKALPGGIIFRVRTEANVGDTLSADDRIESAVGLIDTTTRWRACLALIRIALSSLRIQEVSEACWNVFGMMTTKHSATVSMQERQQLAGALRGLMDKLPADDPRAAYEGQVMAMCMRLAFAENDVEVAHIVPYSSIYMVNGTGNPEDREATVEAMASNVLLAESHARLAEKAPEFLWSRLPATPGRPASAITPPTPSSKAAKAAQDDDEDEDAA